MQKLLPAVHELIIKAPVLKDKLLREVIFNLVRNYEEITIVLERIITNPSEISASRSTAATITKESLQIT